MTTWKISAPVTDYTGEVAGCAFARGRYEGPASAGALNYFRGAGYSVEAVDESPAEPEETEPPAPVPTFADDPKVAPAGNASEADWRTHCLAIGATEDQVKDLKRDQLKELAAKIAKEQQA
ncbi:hypothetical protein [Amycolatopsis kentuckyensis]|uniref:hypothetical protein n=1 Tax=Amycolatopsis kentuckyensis TaxID=218823 RepID=UPI000A3B9E87|nr:hypothetical protein [Amycolatopsis kentuckyensis]